MPANPDRNLLFGILALQLDFITRDQLVSAMNAWVLEKKTPLGEILVRQGGLNLNDRVLLEPMVDRHVQRHGDPAASLAALGPASDRIEQLRAIADVDVQASLARLPVATGAAPTITHEGPSLYDSLRFRILRPHATGGLGQVYVARDQELGRQVALKEIRIDRCDDPGLRGRFLLEAEINGNLEHPGIVPVYGLGSYPDGRPFYAMRFIQGDSLREAVERFHKTSKSSYDSLEFRQLLGRFIDVCDAIAYAHSRGVLHRDLKPANIMLGRFGETLVVDWGLAKAVGTAESADGQSTEATFVPSLSGSIDPTLAGSAMGTPQYMSPEQAEGRLDSLGPATDIYALGATLSALLTGTAPVEGADLGEILRKVVRGEVSAPRDRHPQVPLDLDAVCRKAMALRPDDRYPSARALADDIEHWLADEPVSARVESVFERVRRWARKHRTLVAAAALVLLLSVAGLACFSVVLGSANRALADERRRAEEREQIAIDAVKRFADVVRENPQLSTNPELDSLYKTLLREPQAFFRNLRTVLESTPRTTPESVTRLADATLELAMLTNTIGDKAESLQVMEDSVALLRRLEAMRPDDDKTGLTLAKALDTWATFLILQGDLDQPRVILDEVKRRSKVLMERDSANPEIILLEAAALDHRATIDRRIGRQVDAVNAQDRAIDLLKGLTRDRPQTREVDLLMAALLQNRGLSLAALMRMEGATESLQRAREISARLLAGNPEDPEYALMLAGISSNLLIQLSLVREFDEAQQIGLDSIAILEQACQGNPNHTRLATSLLMTSVNLSFILDRAGRVEEALATLAGAEPLGERIVASHPGYLEAAHGLAVAVMLHAMIDLNRGEFVSGLERAQRARSMLQKLTDAESESGEYRENLATSGSLIGFLLFKLGKSAEAEVAMLEAIDQQRRLSIAAPDNLLLKKSLAGYLTNLALVESQQGKILAAARHFQEAVVHWKEPFSRNPKDPFYTDLHLFTVGPARTPPAESPAKGTAPSD